MDCALSSSSARRGGKLGVRDPVFALIGEGRAHGELDAADRNPHERADLEELEADRGATGLDELRVPEGDAAKGAEENLSEGGEPQPQLPGRTFPFTAPKHRSFPSTVPSMSSSEISGVSPMKLLR